SALRAARADKVDDYIKARMAAHQIPGLSVVVLRRGQVLKRKGYGLASVEFSLPATADTVYHLASVTKIVTGVAIMKLVEEGRLSLDTRVADILDGLPAAWRPITVRHLLTHTSGLKDPFANPRWEGLSEEKQRAMTAAEVLPYITEQPLAFGAGDNWAY